MVKKLRDKIEDMAYDYLDNRGKIPKRRVPGRSYGFMSGRPRVSKPMTELEKENRARLELKMEIADRLSEKLQG
jgi:hypothetical protein